MEHIIRMRILNKNDNKYLNTYFEYLGTYEKYFEQGCLQHHNSLILVCYTK